MPDRSGKMAADCQVLEWLAHTRASRIGRARATAGIADGATVLLKVALENKPAAFRREYALAQTLRGQGIIRPGELLTCGDKLAMVLDDRPVVSFEAWLTDRPLAVEACLKVARSAAQALAELHAAQLLHGDLRPANLLVAPTTHEVLIADLSVAAERGQPPPPIIDWAYIAPEQTGRTNRPADQRADFYALGVLLYRLLTGRLPFQVTDPLEWLHCHIARMPPAPSVLSPGVPLMVSDLAMKLLAKEPEDRYQTAHGLQEDLQRCLREWKAAGTIERFDLGGADATDRLQIPSKLYGRQAERQALLDAFERIAASGRPEVVLVSGHAGIGKTSLVHELRKPLSYARGYFASGTFDSHRRDVPYSALTLALTALMDQILGEPEQRVSAWRQAMESALASNGQLIVDMIPSLALIIGPQPQVPELGPADAENRLRIVFRDFIGAFAKREHPLVIFLDNLQWADAASLALLHELVTHPDIRALLVVSTYRENEMDASHPVTAMLARVRHEGTKTSQITLRPLARADVCAWIADALHATTSQTRQLAELVHARTGGNPFFVTQFLGELHAERLLAFDANRQQWHWDLGAIAAKRITENVVELMVRKLKRLPKTTEQVLERAACLGTEGEIGALAIALASDDAQTSATLQQAADAGLVVFMGSRYRFIHDRVQEAAYGLIAESDRPPMHLEIGRRLLSRLNESDLAQRVFDVAAQLNRGVELVTDPDEMARLGRINRLAGRKAKRAVAFAAAQDHLRRAVAMLPADAWDSDPEGTCTLLLELAECEYVVGDFQRSHEWLEMVLSHSASNLQRARAWGVRQRLHSRLGKYTEAIGAALEGLQLLGEKFPVDPIEAEAMVASQQRDIERALDHRQITDLTNAPPLKDPVVKAVIELLTDAFSPTLLANSPLFPLFVQRATILSLRHGHGEEASLAYGYYARAEALAGDPRAGNEWSELSLRLDERLGRGKYKGRLLFAHCYFTWHWQKDLASGLRALEEARAECLRVGNLFHAAYCIHVMQQFVAECETLDRLLEHCDQHGGFLLRTGNDVVHRICRGWEQLARCLKGLTRGASTFDDDGFNETDHIAFLEGVPSAVGLFGFFTLKEVATYLAGRYAECVEWAQRAQPYMVVAQGSQTETWHRLFLALALAAQCRRDSATDHGQQVEALQEQLAAFSNWSQACPQNFSDRHALLSAELARIEGRELDAERLYEQAMATARSNGFMHIEAIACERAAGYWRERGFDKFADAYLCEARHGYRRWGANAKVRRLEQEHPQLLETTATMPTLDTLAVVRASQAISSRIDLDELLEALLGIALESAGAQTGQLYFLDANELLLSAAATVQGERLEVQVLHGHQAPAKPRPEAILNYVRRSHEQVLLDDATQFGPFSSDEYLRQYRPRSVLCLPLLRRTELIGVLYLENNLSTHAFTPERVTVLSVLASQAAISTETARLYSALKAENAERKRAEELSREREARIQRLVESNIIGIGFADLDGRITEANDAFLHIVGYTREDLTARRLNHMAITAPEFREAQERSRTELMARGSFAPCENEYLRKDGTRVPVLVGGTLFKDADGTPAQTVVFVLDLTERRRAEADRQAREAAEAATQAKSAFLANMSHELRTPLTAILGFAQLLQRDAALGDPQRRKVSIIHSSGSHLLALINDILDLSRAEAGRLDLMPEPVNLRLLVDDVTAIVRVQAEAKQLPFEVDLGEPLPVSVVVDERRLRQVLLNLLANAVKFTERGHVRLSVRSTRVPANGVQLGFDVQDTGVGISPEDLARLFRPFEQAGGARSRAQGTGLGLAISDMLVRSMGGEIQVESTPGRGSRFHFEVPASLGDEAASSAVDVRVINGYEGPRRRVLIADDIPESRAFLNDALQSLDFTTVEASDGFEALERAQASPPDLILIDNSMPGMTGNEALRHMRAHKALADVPVIAVSASASADDQRRSLAAGATAFMPKPVDIDKLLCVIASHLGLKWTYEDSA